MSNNELLELHKRHDDAQAKYTYFLLAVTASAVAFAVQKTDGLSISCSMIPLGLAVLSWGLIFFFGTKNLIWVHTALGANYGLIQLQKGVHPDQPEHPEHLELAIKGITNALNFNINKANFYAIWQYRLLILGAALFLIWHITEMVLRTNTT